MTAEILKFLSESDPSKNIPTDSEAQQYLQHLLSSSLQSLVSEPETLALELQTLEKDYTDTTTKEYKAFLVAHEHLSSLSGIVGEIPPLLDKLVAKVPEISRYLVKLEQAYQASKQVRVSHSKISAQLGYLEPILEIPQLFDTLIRNNHYEEAMELQLFTQRLPIRYPNIPLLSGLARIKTSKQAMLNQLFGMLKGPAKLPLCIRVIGYLRRLGFEDFPLRVLFLNLRYTFVQNLLSLIKEPTAQNQLRRWIEIHREHLLDIILHYKAIFPKDNGNTNEQLVLPMFSLHATNHLLQKVDEFLCQCEDLSMLPSANTQLMFGMSLARIGLDIRPLYVKIFEKTVIRVVAGYFRQAVVEFEVGLKVENSKQLDKPGLNVAKQTILIKCGCLALAYNMYLNGLNQLRYLPCQSTHAALSQSLLTTLGQISDLIIQNSTINRKNAEVMAWIMKECVVVEVCLGLDTVLGKIAKTDTTEILMNLESLAANSAPNDKSRSSVNSMGNAPNINVQDDTNIGEFSAISTSTDKIHGPILQDNQR